MTDRDQQHNARKTPCWICIFGGFLSVVSGSVALLAVFQTVGLLPSRASLTPFRHFGWPIVLLLIGVALATSTWPSPRSRFLQRWQLVIHRLAELWRQRNSRWRLVLCAVLGHLVISSAYLFDSPADLKSTLSERTTLKTTPFRTRSGEPYVHWEYFAPQWKQTIPPRAAIAYRGHWEGPLVAYELYPRRLYLLPEDARRLAAKWHDHRWLNEKTKGKSLRDRWTDEFWFRRTPWPTFDLVAFVRARNIEFLLTFDEADERGCSVGRIEDFLSRKSLSNLPASLEDGPQ